MTASDPAALHRELLDNVEQGFCIFEMIEDAAGRPVDYRFLEVNATFERHSGLKGAVGRTARELVPGLEDHWVETYGRVARTGEPARFEQGSAVMGRVFAVEAIRVGGIGSRRVAVLFRDVTEQERARAERQAREARDRYLLGLEERLRAAPSARAAVDSACAVLAEALGCGVVGVGEIQPDGVHSVVESAFRRDDGPSVLGRHDLREVGAARVAALSRGEVVAVGDVASDPRTADDAQARAAYAAFGARATLDVPLMRDGRLRAILFAADAAPRDWTDTELTLARETLERTWQAVERARAEAALDAGERRLRDLVATLDLGVFMTRTLDGTIRHWSKGCEALYGWSAEEAVGRISHELLRTVHPVPLADLEAALLRDRSWSGELRHRAKDGREVVVVARKVLRPAGEDGPPVVLEAIADVTAQRRAEAALRESDALLRSVFDASTDCVKVVEADGTLTYMNVNGRCLMEIDDFEAVRGRPWPSLWPVTERPRLEAALAQALAGRPTSFEAFCPTAKGTPKWWDVAVAPVQDAAGRVLRVVASSRDITGRRAAEAALRESEQRLRAAQEAGGIGIHDYDVVHDSIVWDARLRAIWGVPDDLPITWDVFASGVLPEDLPAVEAAVARAMDPAGDGRYAAEYRVRSRADGIVRWVAATGRVTFADGRPVRLVGTARDVTAEREAAHAVAESEARFRAFAEAVPGLAWVSTTEGRNLFVNHGFCAYTGRGPEGLLGDAWTGALHPEDAARLGPVWQDCVAAGRVFEAEYRFRRHDGAWRWFLGRTVPQRDAVGAVTQWVGTATDIEDLVRAREALRAANADLERRVEAAIAERERIWRLSPDLFGVLAADGTILSVNPAWSRVLGHPQEALVGRPADAFIHPDDLEPTRAARARLARGELLAGHENRWRHADGTWRWFAWTAIAEGGTTYCIARDVTEQKAAAEKLRATEHELFQAQKMETIGQLTGGVAHDFNNLLAAILSSLEIARRHAQGDPRLLRLIETGIQGAERGATLTRRLLAFARRQELKTEAVDVGRLIGGMNDLLRRTLGPAIRVQTDLPGALPPAVVDPNQLELALLNLAVNARDAMPSGGTLRLAAHAERDPPGLAPGAYVRLTVADDGVGMDPGTLARAAEPFFTTKGVGRGTGLGLSMVQGLALQSGGSLRLESAPGEGTTACLWLPQADDAAALPGPREAGGAAPREPATRTVLVVDDDPLVAMGTVMMLEDLGHRVHEARSGRAALELLDRHPAIDLLVTDHGMPGMTGLELIERVRALRPDLPVVLATGYGELPGGRATDLVRLDKPFSQAALEAALDRALAERATQPA